MKNNYLFKLADIDSHEIMPGFHGKLIHSDQLTMAYWDIIAGSELPEHSHHHEQVVNMFSGKFELVLAGKPYILEAGMILTIPSNVPHSGRAITDCKILDVFTPVRSDYIS